MCALSPALAVTFTVGSPLWVKFTLVTIEVVGLGGILIMGRRLKALGEVSRQTESH
jgi:hypothetical protein